MLIMLIPLVFALGALLAAAALAVTWRHYRHVAFANLEALNRVRAVRDFDVRIGRHPALVGSAPQVFNGVRWPYRPAKVRRSAAGAGLRAAA